MWLNIRLGLFVRYPVPVLVIGSDELAGLFVQRYWPQGLIQFAFRSIVVDTDVSWCRLASSKHCKVLRSGAPGGLAGRHRHHSKYFNSNDLLCRYIGIRHISCVEDNADTQVLWSRILPPSEQPHLAQRL